MIGENGGGMRSFAGRQRERECSPLHSGGVLVGEEVGLKDEGGA